MFYFPNARIPNFKNINDTAGIFEDNYWDDAGFCMRDKLMEREDIFIDWIRPNSRVLSIGCGNSRLLYELKKQKKCDVYGLDISESVINGLKEQDIPAYKADLNRDNFNLGDYFKKDKKFDHIVMSEVLHELVFPENLIVSIKEWSQYFIISLPNSAFYRYRLSLLLGGRFFTQWVKHPAETLRFWSYIDFIEWAGAMGFSVKECRASNGFSLGPVKLYENWKNMFGHQICYLLTSK